jgi:hypothetical protein
LARIAYRATQYLRHPRSVDADLVSGCGNLSSRMIRGTHATHALHRNPTTRHSDINLTMNTYTMLQVLEPAMAVGFGPGA